MKSLDNQGNVLSTVFEPQERATDVAPFETIQENEQELGQQGKRHRSASTQSFFSKSRQANAPVSGGANATFDFDFNVNAKPVATESEDDRLMLSTVFEPQGRTAQNPFEMQPLGDFQIGGVKKSGSKKSLRSTSKKQLPIRSSSTGSFNMKSKRVVHNGGECDVRCPIQEPRQ